MMAMTKLLFMILLLMILLLMMPLLIMLLLMMNPAAVPVLNSAQSNPYCPSDQPPSSFLNSYSPLNIFLFVCSPYSHILRSSVCLLVRLQEKSRRFEQPFRLSQDHIRPLIISHVAKNHSVMTNTKKKTNTKEKTKSQEIIITDCDCIMLSLDQVFTAVPHQQWLRFLITAVKRFQLFERT